MADTDPVLVQDIVTISEIANETPILSTHKILVEKADGSPAWIKPTTEKAEVGLGKVANKTEAEMVADGAIKEALGLKADKATPSVSVIASKTLGLTDASTLQICNSASSITITIPTNAVTAFPVGTEIVLTRYGTGAVTIAGAVTIRSAVSMKSISIQYGAVSLYKIATDEWLLIGALS